jgi:hypothetical protein
MPVVRGPGQVARCGSGHGRRLDPGAGDRASDILFFDHITSQFWARAPVHDGNTDPAYTSTNSHGNNGLQVAVAMGNRVYCYSNNLVTRGSVTTVAPNSDEHAGAIHHRYYSPQ